MTIQNQENTAKIIFIFAAKSHFYSVLSNHSQSDLSHFRLQMSRASKILQRLTRKVKRINIDKRSQVNQYLQSHDFMIKIDNQDWLHDHIENSYDSELYSENIVSI